MKYDLERMRYDPSLLSLWVETVARQSDKDKLFLSKIESYFSKGNVLEVGGGCGQLSQILKNRGWDVTASDYAPFFVEYMRSQGLKAMEIDATNITKDTIQKFDNILSQGSSPLVAPDVNLLEKTYNSIYDALKPSGRFVFFAYITKKTENYNSIKDHREVIAKTKFKVVEIFRHQIFPSTWYSFLPAGIAQACEDTIGRKLGIRWVIVLEK